MFSHLPIGARLILAVLLEAGWEILENTPFIIQRYRADTISAAYYGDTIVNSLSDTLTAVVGFLFAASFPPTVTIAIEVGLALAIRDNLTLNIVMLVHQVPWIKAWQAAGQAH
jgi:hypothetical protein